MTSAPEKTLRQYRILEKQAVKKHYFNFFHQYQDWNYSYYFTPVGCLYKPQENSLHITGYLLLRIGLQRDPPVTNIKDIRQLWEKVQGNEEDDFLVHHHVRRQLQKLDHLERHLKDVVLPIHIDQHLQKFFGRALPYHTIYIHPYYV